MRSIQDLIDLMMEGTKTPIDLFHELHHQLEGKEIFVGEIPKMDTPLDLFSSGTHWPQSVVETTKTTQPHVTSFSIQVGLFPTPNNAYTKMQGSKIVPSIVASLKSLEDHLFHSNSFAQTMSNFSKAL
jgi:hypothetical protein